tara:strand:- start:206 stop:742 length:537 start_codon:yes stop_codon:yes gene_type:complete
MANKNDKIGIEGEFAELEDIKEAVKEFYVHPEGTPNQPKYDTLVTIERCQKRLDNLQIALAAYPDAAVYKIDEGIWSRRLDACNALIDAGKKGEFQVLPANATVSIQMDNSTKYITYMKVLDQIMQGLNELRDEYSKENFGVPFSKLNDKVESDKRKIVAIRQVYPKKIMKEKNRSVQ